jgi:pilus assembly protein CpaF
MVLLAGTELPSRAAREQIVSALQLLVHVRRHADGVRRIDSVSEITGLEGVTPLVQEIYRFRRTGRDGRKVIGEFETTGVVPRMVEDIRDAGTVVPPELFQPHRNAHS